MTAIAIVEKLQAAGVRFSVTLPDRLRVRAPRGVVTPALRSTLVHRKPQVLCALAERQRQAAIASMLRNVNDQLELRQQLEFEIEERAAILEFDGNMPRQRAEREAKRMTLEVWCGVIDATDGRAA